MAKRPDLSPPTRPMPKRSNSKAIVEAILQASCQLPSDASMTEIAERAGVGVASVYRYFPTRDAIYAELARDVHHQIKLETLQMLDEATQLEDAIRACVQLGFRMSEEHKRVLDHTHTNLPFSWYQSALIPITDDLVRAVEAWFMKHTDIPENTAQARAHLIVVILRGSARARTLKQVEDTDLEGRLLEAALLAVATTPA